MEDELNLRIARGIWEVLQTSPTIVMSWGLEPTTVKYVESGLQFHVDGFKHTGNVVIKLNQGADLYEFYLYDESGKLKESHTGIYVDQLIDMIDSAVEYTGADYEERCNARYPGLSSARKSLITRTQQNWRIDEDVDL